MCSVTFLWRPKILQAGLGPEGVYSAFAFHARVHDRDPSLDLRPNVFSMGGRGGRQQEVKAYSTWNAVTSNASMRPLRVHRKYALHSDNIY